MSTAIQSDITDLEILGHIERLRKGKIVGLDSVQGVLTWLQRKQNARQCGRILGGRI
jgi:hypothetical protein